MRKIWKSNRISLKVKMRLYESVILSNLLYSAELWPLTATLSKRLDAAHHRWLSILGVSWKDKVTNEEVRARTGQQSILNTLSGRRLRCMARSYDTDGSSPHYTSSTILGSPRFQEGTRPAKDKLERHSQERFARNGTYLGRGGGGSSQQTRMASECGPVRSRGRGMNQVKSP